jgi:uncharacterized protein (TIGR02246 family)
MNKLILTAALLFAVPSFAGEPDAPLQALIRTWADRANAHDVKGLTALYAADPQFIYAFEGQEGRGAEALTAFWTGFFQSAPDVALTLKSYEVVMLSPTSAMGLGVWEDAFTGPDGKKLQIPTHSSEVFVKVKGQWRILVDHASFVPPQPPPPTEKT